jgi:hypothetical protein
MASFQRTPLFEAENSDRYDRQRIIREYQQLKQCNLLVLIDQIIPPGMTFVEELLYQCDPEKPIHLMLASPGGDAETAVRIVRSVQSRCSELTIVIPDMAKSAATILCLGADRLLFGPGGDIGPVDPQLRLADGFASAKDVVESVAEAERRIKDNPATFPLFANLLAQVNMIAVEQARAALDRSSALVREALSSNPRRGAKAVGRLAAKLQTPLIDEPTSHSAVTSCAAAKRFGLPAAEADPSSAEWRLLWGLWARYFDLGAFPAGRTAVYEAETASHVFDRGQRR